MKSQVKLFVLSMSLALAAHLATRSFAREPLNNGDSTMVKNIHVRLLVNDFPQALHFYKDVLGLKPGYVSKNNVYADISAGGLEIALFDKSLMAQDTGIDAAPKPNSDSAALIFEVDSVDGAYKRLNSEGVSFLTEPHDKKEWGIRVAHFRDPDGNLIEINAPIK